MKNEEKYLKAKCPRCEKSFNFHVSEDRPFCSEQCKTIDMGSWLREDYSIAGKDNSVYIEDPEMMQKLLDESDENQ
jgi:endogenous inhibitor of DNA gyrase (YacG/DUF329 family)